MTVPTLAAHESAGLTPYAAGALAAAHEAAAQRGELVVRPDHLLHGLVARPDGTACVLLDRMAVSLDELRETLGRRLGPPAEDPCRETHLSPEVERVLRDAREEAAFMQDALAGTEHLLLGLAHSRNDASRLLDRLAADFAGLRQEVAALRRLQDSGGAPARAAGDAPPRTAFGSAPLPAALAAGFGVLQSAGLLVLSPVVLYTAFTAPDTEMQWRRGLILVAWLWTALWGFLLGPGLLKRLRGAWTATEAFLMAKSVGSLVALVPAIFWTRAGRRPLDGLEMFGFELLYLYAVSVLTLTVTLFRCAGWYGVRKEQAWRAVLREKGWLLAITLLLEALVVSRLGVRPW